MPLNNAVNVKALIITVTEYFVFIKALMSKLRKPSCSAAVLQQQMVTFRNCGVTFVPSPQPHLVSACAVIIITNSAVCPPHS